MYAIAFFGILMSLLSVAMAIDPDGWSERILQFSRKTYFHGFEIISRVFFGALFVRFAQQTLYPTVIAAFGYLMLAVGLGLLLAGAARHRRFAAWSAARFNNRFRPAGIAGTGLGLLIVYAALSGP